MRRFWIAAILIMLSSAGMAQIIGGIPAENKEVAFIKKRSNQDSFKVKKKVEKILTLLKTQISNTAYSNLIPRDATQSNNKFANKCLSSKKDILSTNWRKRWWVCVYEDGTRVYNNFRRHRTYSDVSAYFYGRITSGDCDAWSFGCGDCKLRRVCYPSQSLYMIRKHGNIISIHLEGPPNNPQSDDCDGERRECD